MLNKMSHTEFQDVHHYDEKILMPVFQKQFTKQEKLEQIKILLPKLTKTTSMQMMQLIIKSITDENLENYDAINRIDASDILAAILSKSYDNILDIFEEQLEDIWLLGRCPQGRTIRFIQLYKAVESVESVETVESVESV